MLNVITLFSGYDSQCLALNRLGVDYNLVAWAEIDRYAIKAHDALFPQYADRNLGDVSNVVWSQIDKPIDILTYSSPCQDFSQAGLQRGGEKGSGTRSGLLWECERAIGVLKPRYLVFENVPALVSDKFFDTFLAWGKVLQLMGYRNYWRCLNAKHYGVPQNRNRVFLVSILGDGQPYYFPEPFKLERRLKDVLEQQVDERYYLSEERLQGLMLSTEKEREAGRGFEFQPKTVDDEVANSITTNAGGRKTDNFISEPTIEIVGDLQPDNKRNISGNVRQQNTVVGTSGISPCIPSSNAKHDFKIMEPQVLGWTRDEKGNVIDYHPVDTANCVTSAKRDNTQNFVLETGIRVRRLTERELFRLMDVDEKDIDTLLSAGIPKTQLSKLAGNSIAVNVIYHIFRTLLVDTEPQKGQQTTLF